MYGFDLLCGVSKDRLGKINIKGNQRSAHTIQILKIAFPPRILPKNEAVITNGKRNSMIVINSIKAYMQ
jgi:hypothetical protein